VAAAQAALALEAAARAMGRTQARAASLVAEAVLSSSDPSNGFARAEREYADLRAAASALLEVRRRASGRARASRRHSACSLLSQAALARSEDGERKRAVHVSFGGNASRLAGIYVQKLTTSSDAGGDDPARDGLPLVYSRVLDADTDALAEDASANAPATHL
jgi:hypothetical protein